MKTKAIAMPFTGKVLLFWGIAVLAFASMTLFARADVAPTVTTTVHNASNVPVTSAVIGTTVHATVQVASTSATTSPVGTVEINRYENTSCVGTPSIQSGVVLVNGAATSSAFVLPASGVSYKVHYNGQTGVYSESDSACASVTAVSTSPSLTTTLSSTSVSVGSSVSESATLSNATSNAGGSVSYAVYSNNSCTNLWNSAGVKTVTNASVPSSDSILFNTIGTYYWRAIYSGDAQNGAATSSCLSLSVLATTTPPAGPGSISGKVYNDLDRDESLDQNEPGIANFTVNLYQGAHWPGQGKKGPFKAATTDGNGNYSFPGLADGIYSVELIRKAGWHQDTGDYRRLEIKSGSSIANIDFANSSTTPRVKDKDDDDDDDKDKKDKDKKLKHRGWWWGWHWGWWKHR